jgi:ABC-type sugar transport system, permease component
MESTAVSSKTRRRPLRNRFEALDLALFILLTLWAFIIVVPFYNVIVTSFVTQKEYLSKAIVLWPEAPTLDNYARLFKDGRIWVGYRTTLIFLGIGMPVNMFLTTTVAYAMSKRRYPGKKLFFFMILVTMLFNGGIVPMYLLMKELHLTNTIWSVIFAYGLNTFYMIIMMNYFQSLPESLMEAAKLDGAGEWRVLIDVVLPLSMPIIATIMLFYSVDRWNEWFNPLIFLRKNDIVPLQLVLRNIVIDSQVLQTLAAGGAVSADEQTFSMGLKMGAVMVTTLPVMCVFPFLQRHFVKGIMIGAIKA